MLGKHDYKGCLKATRQSKMYMQNRIKKNKKTETKGLQLAVLFQDSAVL